MYEESQNQKKQQKKLLCVTDRSTLETSTKTLGRNKYLFQLFNSKKKTKTIFQVILVL